MRCIPISMKDNIHRLDFCFQENLEICKNLLSASVQVCGDSPNSLILCANRSPRIMGRASAYAYYPLPAAADVSRSTQVEYPVSIGVTKACTCGRTHLRPALQQSLMLYAFGQPTAFASKTCVPDSAMGPTAVIPQRCSATRIISVHHQRAFPLIGCIWWRPIPFFNSWPKLVKLMWNVRWAHIATAQFRSHCMNCCHGGGCCHIESPFLQIFCNMLSMFVFKRANLGQG